MAKLVNQIDENTKVFGAILALGLTGLLFLIVFGNLSGNLGFQDTTNTRTNESNNYAINETTYTLAGQSVGSFVSLSVLSVYNASDGVIVGSGNYTVDSTAGTIAGVAWPGRTANWTNINVTYTVTNNSIGEADTNSVIGNLTGGATTFFSFSNVWFTLLAVVLLIIIVMSVIGVVNRKGQSGFSS